MDTISRAPPPAVPAYLLDLLRPLHQLMPLGDCSSVATHPKARVRASAKTKTRGRRFRDLCRNSRHFRRSSMMHKVVAPQTGAGPLHASSLRFRSSLLRRRELWKRCPELGVASGPYADAFLHFWPWAGLSSSQRFPGLFLDPGIWDALGEAGEPSNTFSVGSEACVP